MTPEREIKDLAKHAAQQMGSALVRTADLTHTDSERSTLVIAAIGCLLMGLAKQAAAAMSEPATPNEALHRLLTPILETFAELDEMNTPATKAKRRSATP